MISRTGCIMAGNGLVAAFVAILPMLEIVGKPVSVTVKTATALVTDKAPGAERIARYRALLSVINTVPTTNAALVAPAVGIFVQPPVALLVRCQR